MDLSSIVATQIAADRRRGFKVDFSNDAERVAQLERDVVGLTGEVGEFANALKKVRLALDHPNYPGPAFQDIAQNLREELADAFIYLMRLSFISGGDLEADLLNKMKVNDARYSQFER
jgi:NTP pyrophosphatase (non-canonical NTP hydrolase)